MRTIFRLNNDLNSKKVSWSMLNISRNRKYIIRCISIDIPFLARHLYFSPIIDTFFKFLICSVRYYPSDYFRFNLMACNFFGLNLNWVLHCKLISCSCFMKLFFFTAKISLSMSSFIFISIFFMHFLLIIWYFRGLNWC